MNPDSNAEAFDLKKPLLAEIVEDNASRPAVDLEASVPQLTSSSESRPVFRVKAFFSRILYTVAFAIVTLILCLHGSSTIGFPRDERSAVYARTTYASILGSVVLGPVYFTNKWFMTSTKAKYQSVNIHLANGRLLKALGHSVLFCAVVTGIVASAASLGHGLIFWSLVYSESASTEKMVIDAVLVPVACLLGGLWLAYEMISVAMWGLIRIPRISTGLEGDKYDRLMKMAIIFTVFRLLTEGVAAILPLCVLLLKLGLMDKFVTYYDKYREPVVEAIEPQPKLPSVV